MVPIIFKLHKDFLVIMRNRQLTAQEKLDRLKWKVYGLSLLFLAGIEFYNFFRGLPVLDNVIDLLLGAGGVGILVEFAFWNAKQLQHQLDEELQNSQRHIRQMVSLHTATTALVMTHDLRELIERILEATMNAIDRADTGSIYLIDPDTKQLNLATLRGTDSLELESSKDLEAFAGAYQRGYADRVIQTKEAILISDAHLDDEDREVQDSEPKFAVRSMILAPLLLEDRGVGVLALNSFSPAAFSNMDLASLRTFATTAAAAILNARLYEETHYLAVTDVLTGLNNRRYFFELARSELGRARRYQRSLSLLMMDLDHFKQVNDRFGHTVGDRVLRAVAQRCKEIVREQDIIGRYGGEEFAVMLPEADSRAAFQTANRIRERIAEAPFTTSNGDQIGLTVSIGVATLDEDTRDLTTFVNAADTALYKAKESGKDCIVVV